MSKLGVLLQTQADALLGRWTESIGQGCASSPELREYVPGLLQELCEALREGRAPVQSVAALDHGERGQKLGVDVEAVVREYRLLLNAILDSAEAEGLSLTISEIRIVTDFMSRAIAHCVAAHRCYEERRTLERDTPAHDAALLREAELRAVVDAVPLLVSFVTADERYGLANQSYEQWFGIARDSQRGRTVLEVIGEEAYAQLGPLVKRALAGEQFTVQQYDVKHVHGGTRDVSITFVPRRDARGEVAGYVSIIDDLTARRRLEAERERLLEAERTARREGDTFRELVEVERDLATAVATMEADSRRASEEARARTEFLLTLAGALAESLELEVMLQRLVEIIAPAHALLASVWGTRPGQGFRRLVHGPFREALADSDASPTLRSEGAVALSFRHVLETGEMLLVDDYAAWMIAAGASREVGESIEALGAGPALFFPIRRGSDAVAVLGICRSRDASFAAEDIAVFESVAHLTALAFENARLFGEMARLRSAAEAATEAKDGFLAQVSHDLRNPLNSILGWSALLRGMKGDHVQVMRGIDVIERNAKAQVQLIDDLLDVSRITSGKLALELALADVRAAFDTGLDAARLAASSKNVQLVVTVDADIGAITVDPDRFRQILWNLVSNAVKFTPSGGTVRVNARRQASTFQLVISDTGRGISADFLPSVFASLQQAEAGVRRAGGLGLGLAIVQHLVKLHGGTIRAESEGVGKGACFTVELPIRAAVRSLDRAEAETPRVLAGVRVLVVDDEEDARGVVAAILEHAGGSVRTVSSVAGGLAALTQAVPDVIVSDVNMPGKDGKAFIREVRGLAEVRGGRLPVVALTALVGAQDRVEILAAGFDAYVSKPVEPAELVLVVAGLLA